MGRGIFYFIQLGILLTLTANTFAQTDGASNIAGVYSFSILDNTSSIAMVRPGESYLSVRIRGISSGLAGLIADPYSDYLRNPGSSAAIDLPQLYCDVSRSENGERVSFGAFGRNVNQTLSILAYAKDLLRQTESFGQGSATSNGSSINSLNSDHSNASVGLNLRYSAELQSGTSLGIAYELTYNDANSSSSYSNFYATGMQEQSGDMQQSSLMNKITVGALFPTKKGSMQFYAAFALSYLRPSETGVDISQQDTFYSDTHDSFSLSLYERSFLAGVILEKQIDEANSLRYLVEISYSPYAGSGKHAYHDTSSSILAREWSYSSLSPAGRCWEARVGVAWSRKLADKLAFYLGVNAAYASNSTNSTETPDARLVYDTTKIPGIVDVSYRAASISLPLGFEYDVDNSLTLRGGAEEGYAYSNAERLARSVVSNLGNSNGAFLDGLLWSNISAGMTLHAKGIAEITTFVSYNFQNISGCALSVKYLL
jgi:hypothetical protein